MVATTRTAKKPSSTKTTARRIPAGAPKKATAAAQTIAILVPVADLADAMDTTTERLHGALAVIEARKGGRFYDDDRRSFVFNRRTAELIGLHRGEDGRWFALLPGLTHAEAATRHPTEQHDFQEWKNTAVYQGRQPWEEAAEMEEAALNRAPQDRPSLTPRIHRSRRPIPRAPGYRRRPAPPVTPSETEPADHEPRDQVEGRGDSRSRRGPQDDPGKAQARSPRSRTLPEARRRRPPAPPCAR